MNLSNNGQKPTEKLYLIQLKQQVINVSARLYIVCLSAFVIWTGMTIDVMRTGARKTLS